MKKIIKAAFVACAFLLPVSAMATPFSFLEGTHYFPTSKRIATANDDVVEVIELFSYSCPHCFHFDPKVQEWKSKLPANSKVKFTYVPAIFRDSWLELAKVFYAAEVTGDLKQLHPLLFKAIHVDKRHLTTAEQLLDFVEEQGIDRTNFAKVMDSFAVKSKVKKALVISRTSGITGVPSIIVNGEYRTSAPDAGGMDEMLNVVDFLVEKY